MNLKRESVDFHFLNFSTKERFFQLATIFLRNKNTLSLQETTVNLESHQKLKAVFAKYLLIRELKVRILR